MDKTRTIIILLFTLGFMFAEVVQAQSTRRLISTLLDPDRYVRRQIPSRNNNLTSRVHLSLTVVVEQINEMMDRKQELHWAGFVRAIWNDPLLTWKPDEWGGVNHIFVRESDIWVPDVCILERLDDDIGFKEQKRRLLYVTYKGDVKWSLGGELMATRCPLNIYKFPFDHQSCSMTVGSYIIPVDEMKLIDNKDSSYTPLLPDNALWSVTGTESKIINDTWVTDLGSSEYAYLYFTIHLRRKPAYFVVNMIVPLVLISGLMLMTFLLPPDGGEKISFGITLLLAFNVIQLVMTDTMPQTSSLPIITIYITALFVMSALLIPLSVISAYVHTNGTIILPPCIQRLFHEKPDQIITSSYTKRASEDNRNIFENTRQNGSHKELRNDGSDPFLAVLYRVYEDSVNKRKKGEEAEERERDDERRRVAAKKIDFFFMKVYGFALAAITVACMIALIV